MFKVALIGSTCVGKTSVLNNLKIKYQQNPLVAFSEEGARAYYSTNPHITDRGSLQTQAGISDWIMKSESNAHAKSAKIIICDRSILDAIIYMEAHGKKEIAQTLLLTYADWLKTYNEIILMDCNGVPYIPDEIRNESEEFRN